MPLVRVARCVCTNRAKDNITSFKCAQNSTTLYKDHAIRVVYSSKYQQNTHTCFTRLHSTRDDFTVLTHSRTRVRLGAPAPRGGQYESWAPTPSRDKTTDGEGRWEMLLAGGSVRPAAARGGSKFMCKSKQPGLRNALVKSIGCTCPPGGRNHRRSVVLNIWRGSHQNVLRFSKN